MCTKIVNASHQLVSCTFVDNKKLPKKTKLSVLYFFLTTRMTLCDFRKKINGQRICGLSTEILVPLSPITYNKFDDFHCVLHQPIVNFFLIRYGLETSLKNECIRRSEIKYIILAKGKTFLA